MLHVPPPIVLWRKKKKRSGLGPHSKLPIPINEKMPISAPIQILQIGSVHPYLLLLSFFFLTPKCCDCWRSLAAAVFCSISSSATVPSFSFTAKRGHCRPCLWFSLLDTLQDSLSSSVLSHNQGCVPDKCLKFRSNTYLNLLRLKW